MLPYIMQKKQKFTNLSHKMRHTYMQSTEALIKAVEIKDPYTKNHAQNVARYAVAVAEAMGMTEDEVEVVRYAALLHDVGKIGVDQSILVKKEKLTERINKTITSLIRTRFPL